MCEETLKAKHINDSERSPSDTRSRSPFSLPNPARQMALNFDRRRIEVIDPWSPLSTFHLSISRLPTFLLHRPSLVGFLLRCTAELVAIVSSSPSRLVYHQYCTKSPLSSASRRRKQAKLPQLYSSANPPHRFPFPFGLLGNTIPFLSFSFSLRVL